MKDFKIVFESERIYFIKLTEKLVNDYLKMINDPEVKKTISRKKSMIFTLEMELEWIREKLTNNTITYSMIDKETNEFIGNIEIMKINNNFGEVGIAITQKQQNKHYGQEALQALFKYAVNELGLDGLELNVYDFNPRGIHCYEKVGFVKTGKGKTEEEIHMIKK